MAIKNSRKGGGYRDSEGISESNDYERYHGNPIAGIRPLTPRERAACVRTLAERRQIESLDALEARIWSEIGHAVLQDRHELLSLLKDPSFLATFVDANVNTLTKIADRLAKALKHPIDNGGS
jgi:hypothetical protein